MCWIRDDQDGLVIFFCNDESSDQLDVECTMYMQDGDYYDPCLVQDYGK